MNDRDSAILIILLCAWVECCYRKIIANQYVTFSYFEIRSIFFLILFDENVISYDFIYLPHKQINTNKVLKRFKAALIENYG